VTLEAPPVGRRTFAEVSGLVPHGPGRFDAEVDPEWTIGGKPNGGYLLSMLGKAAASVSDHDHVVAASAHYLRSPDPGPVTIEARLLRGGRTASQIRASMSQGDQDCVEALITASHLDGDSVPYWKAGLPEMTQTSFDDCSVLVPQMPDGTRVAIMEQVEVRLDATSMASATGRVTGRGQLRGWLALPGGEAFDPDSLLYAVDALPPATFDIERAGWVPTLELTAYIRALPAPGPVRVLQRAHLIDARRVDESCFVWDSTGRLVAQGTQLAGIRLG
jgi:acyl-coenzyme A thioesterase PaaI-like protein